MARMAASGKATFPSTPIMTRMLLGEYLPNTII